MVGVDVGSAEGGAEKFLRGAIVGRGIEGADAEFERALDDLVGG